MMLLKNPALLRSHAYLNGAWVAADDGSTLTVTNPATGAIIATVPRCSAAQTRAAIDGALLAQRAWRKRLLPNALKSYRFGISSCWTIRKIWRNS